MITSTPSNPIPYTTPTTVLNHTAHVNASGYIVDDDPDDLGMYLFATSVFLVYMFQCLLKDCPVLIRYSLCFYLFTVKAMQPNYGLS